MTNSGFQPKFATTNTWWTMDCWSPRGDEPPALHARQEGKGLNLRQTRDVTCDGGHLMPGQHTEQAFETAILIAKIREGIKKLKEYRTALISAAVTDKIDVLDAM